MASVDTVREGDGAGFIGSFDAALGRWRAGEMDDRDRTYFILAAEALDSLYDGTIISADVAFDRERLRELVAESADPRELAETAARTLESMEAGGTPEEADLQATLELFMRYEA